MDQGEKSRQAFERYQAASREAQETLAIAKSHEIYPGSSADYDAAVQSLVAKMDDLEDELRNFLLTFDEPE